MTAVLKVRILTKIETTFEKISMDLAVQSPMGSGCINAIDFGTNSPKIRKKLVMMTTTIPMAIGPAAKDIALIGTSFSKGSITLTDAAPQIADARKPIREI